MGSDLGRDMLIWSFEEVWRGVQRCGCRDMEVGRV